jgi:pyrroloquinoline quinone (PQQ) biosynthesis protein C
MPFIKNFLSAKRKHFPNLLYSTNQILELKKWGIFMKSFIIKCKAKDLMEELRKRLKLEGNAYECKM